MIYGFDGMRYALCIDLGYWLGIRTSGVMAGLSIGYSSSLLGVLDCLYARNFTFAKSHRISNGTLRPQHHVVNQELYPMIHFVAHRIEFLISIHDVVGSSPIGKKSKENKNLNKKTDKWVNLKKSRHNNFIRGIHRKWSWMLCSKIKSILPLNSNYGEV